MNANELRIGNLVNETNIGICEIDIDDLQNIARGDTNYQPIPLTEEWLLKFGFEKSVNGYPYKFLNGFIKIRNGVYFYKYYHLDIELQHLHQLQNLYFALTNKEL